MEADAASGFSRHLDEILHARAAFRLKRSALVAVATKALGKWPAAWDQGLQNGRKRYTLGHVKGIARRSLVPSSQFVLRVNGGRR